MAARSTCCISVVGLFVLLSSGCGGEADSPMSAQPIAENCSRYDSYSGQTLVGDPDPAPAPGSVILGAPGQEVGARQSPLLETISAQGDHVRFDIVGDGFMGWSVRFVQDPRLRVTDESVQVSGKCILQVDLSGVESANGSSGKLAPETASGVVEVLNFPASDAMAQTFVGTRFPDPVVSVDVTPMADRTAIVLSVAASK